MLQLARRSAASLRAGRSLSLPRAPPSARWLSSSFPCAAPSAGDENPLLECVRARALPPFERLQIEHIAPAVRAAAAAYSRDLHALEQALGAAVDAQAPVRWEDVVDPLERQSDPLARVWGVVGHLMSVRNSDELRQAHDALQQLVIETFTEAAQSQTLFRALQAVRADAAQWAALSLAQQRVVELALRSASLSGVGLEGEQKEAFNKLKLRSAELSTKFASNLLDATKAYSLVVTDKKELEGLPPSLLQFFSQNAREGGFAESTAEQGPWRITLDPPSYVQFMKYAANRSLRETLYRAYATRASSKEAASDAKRAERNNEGIIEELLSVRKQIASLLGFDTYADVSLSRKMAPSVAAVDKMHHDLRDKCLAMAKDEVREVEAFAAASGAEVDGALAPWDLAYWSEKLKAERFLFTDEDVKPYFPLERVLDGLFSLTSRLFGVTIEAADGQAEVWHPDVRFFHVRSSTPGDADEGEVIASFFLDPYSRPSEKNGGAWMNSCVDRSRLLGPASQGGKRNPVAYLICNQSPPVGSDTPSLMTFREVETLFHEFGHGLQHMLTRVPFGDVAGINGVEWDAVELPSQMMENFCYDQATIASISGHYQTGAPLPADLFAKLKSARNFMVATAMLRQLGFGALDMHLHARYAPGGAEEPLFAAQRRVLAQFAVLPPLEDDRFLCSFSHIFAGGYAAGYYSYKWAEILSCDAFGAFEEAAAEGPAAVQRVGRRFRETVLGLGGGQHPLEVFAAFRGREPSMEPLLRQYGLATPRQEDLP